MSQLAPKADRMICCLCRKPIRRAVHELRRTAAGGREEAWAYCRPCWVETLRQRECLATEPVHGRSPLVAGARINIVRVPATRQGSIA